MQGPGLGPGTRIRDYMDPGLGPGTRIRDYMDPGSGPLVLDGGLATDLEAHGAKLQGDPLWSARLLLTDPDAIRDAHYRFLAAGADVITTATYQATVSGVMTHAGVSADAARDLLRSGVQLARDAVDHFLSQTRTTGTGPGRRPLVAASLGPYGVFLHDGSEYSGDYVHTMSVQELKVWHRTQLDPLLQAGPDLVAMETIPSLKEAKALLELLREFPDCRAWISFSCKDSRSLRDGTGFGDAVRTVMSSSQVVAAGLNCCSPDLVQTLLDSAGPPDPDRGWVVYPNSGEAWDPQHGWTPGPGPGPGPGPVWRPGLCQTWRSQGAALIGGCCRVSPAHIADLRAELTGSGS